MSITTVKTKYKVRYSLFSYSTWVYLELPRQYTFESSLSIKLFPETFKWGEKIHTDMVWYFTIDFSQSKTDKRRKYVEHQHSSLGFLTEKKYEQLPSSSSCYKYEYFLPPCPSHHNEHNLKAEKKYTINIKARTEKWSYCCDKIMKKIYSWVLSVLMFLLMSSSDSYHWI